MSRPRLLRRFGRLSWKERGAVCRAAVLLLLARAALAVLPLRTVLRIASRGRARNESPCERLRLERMVRAVAGVGNRLFPRNPCLTQAIVVQRLLVRAGRDAVLRIGVHREGGSVLKAHAWVESNGEIVIGSEGLSDDYVPLPPIRPGPSSSGGA